MKRVIFLLVILLLQACTGSFTEGRSLFTPTISLNTPLSLLLPPKWTVIPSSTENYHTTPSANPTQVKATLTSSTSIGNFDLIKDTLITLVRTGWIYAVNWQGEIMPIWNMKTDNLINSDAIHMEISPDRKYLAFSGIGTDGRPSLEVLDLASLNIIEKETFEGTLVTDFTWSSNSKSIAAAVVIRHNNHDFDTMVFLLDPSHMQPKGIISELNHRILSQIIWPRDDRIIYTDFSCNKNPELNLPVWDTRAYGTTGIDVYNFATKGMIHRDMVATIDWPGGKINVSPDKSQILFFSWWPGLSQAGINALLMLETLKPVSCSFCGGFYDMIWFEHYILGDFPMYGAPDGTIYLLDISNEENFVISIYGTFGPHSRIYSDHGVTAWIDYEEVDEPRIWVTNIQACLKSGWGTSECQKAMWDIQGQWPNSYNNNLWNLDINCSESD